MPLTNIGLSAQVNWNLQNGTATGFIAATESDSLQWILTNLNLTTYNQIYAATLSIAASSSTTLDLTSLTNLVGEFFSFGHVLGIFVNPTTTDITVGPGTSNGLQWMWDDATAKTTIHNGGIWVWSDPSTGPGTVVDSTHKTLTFTNLSGSTAASVDLIIFGSTT